jgi:hypothetical protein
LSGDLVDAVEFEVKQFADAQPACPLHQQGVGGETIRRFRQCGGEFAVGVHG